VNVMQAHAGLLRSNSDVAEARAIAAVTRNADVLQHLLTFLNYVDTSMFGRVCKSLRRFTWEATSFAHVSLADMPQVKAGELISFLIRWPKCSSWNVAIDKGSSSNDIRQGKI
jgi:hypothetical protein